MDINTDLPQVLQDGTNSYVYGLGNLAQTDGSTTDYFLPDALGSTRQLVNADDQLTLIENYDPFGNTIASMGSDNSIFDYTGQQTDPTGLQYLRARYYDPSVGMFTSRDTWSGDANNPISFNHWAYTDDNPINLTDPSGHDPWWCEPPYDTSGNTAECYMEMLYPKGPGPLVSILSGKCPYSPSAFFEGPFWKITYYNYAMESDPFLASDKQPIKGLSKEYRSKFVWNRQGGIALEGTGLADDGQYITIDYSKTNAEYHTSNYLDWINSTDPSTWYYTTGQGGAYGIPIPWKTVAVSKEELAQGFIGIGTNIQIDGYSQTFKVEDTGSFTDVYHIDIFIGPTTHDIALAWGTQKEVKVWVVGY